MHQSNYYDEDDSNEASDSENTYVDIRYFNSLVRYLVLSLIVTNYVFYEKYVKRFSASILTCRIDFIRSSPLYWYAQRTLPAEG